MSESSYSVNWQRFGELSEASQRHYRRATGNMTLQYPPMLVDIEPVEGCRWRCVGCGMAGIRHATEDGGSAAMYQFMEIRVAEIIAAQMAALEWWQTRVTLSGRGEPTMHPGLCDIVAALRSRLRTNPIALVTSGQGLLPAPGPLDRIMQLYEAGVTFVAVTEHEPSVSSRIREITPLLARAGVTIDKFQDGDVVSEDSYARAGRRMLGFLPPHTLLDGARRRARNLAGAGHARDLSQRHQPCQRPFRELAIRWNGAIPLCMDDWRGVYKCGAVVRDGIAAVWDGEPMAAARRQLIRDRVGIALCRSCNSPPVRTRHLPDPRGVTHLAPPRPEDAMTLQEAQAGDGWTRSVRQWWE